MLGGEREDKSAKWGQTQKDATTLGAIDTELGPDADLVKRFLPSLHSELTLWLDGSRLHTLQSVPQCNGLEAIGVDHGPVRVQTKHVEPLGATSFIWGATSMTTRILPADRWVTTSQWLRWWDRVFQSSGRRWRCTVWMFRIER